MVRVGVDLDFAAKLLGLECRVRASLPSGGLGEAAFEFVLPGARLTSRFGKDFGYVGLDPLDVVLRGVEGTPAPDVVHKALQFHTPTFSTVASPTHLRHVWVKETARRAVHGHQRFTTRMLRATVDQLPATEVLCFDYVINPQTDEAVRPLIAEAGLRDARFGPGTAELDTLLGRSGLAKSLHEIGYRELEILRLSAAEYGLRGRRSASSSLRILWRPLPDDPRDSPRGRP